MQRAATVNGRLQSKGSDGSESDDLVQTDSDKENWVPSGPKTQRGRKVYESPAVQRTRKILGENTEIMSQSNSLGYMLERSGMTPRKTPRRSSDPEQDDELRAFMGGDDGMSGRTAVSSAEEAGCVEGLLKLSQGQWRGEEGRGYACYDWYDLCFACIWRGTWVGWDGHGVYNRGSTSVRIWCLGRR